MRKEYKVLAAAIFLSFVMVFFGSIGNAQDDLSTKQKELLRIQQRLAEKRQQLLIAKKNEQNSLQKLFVVKYELDRTRRDLYSARGRLEYHEGRVSELSAELVEAQKKLASESDQLGKRLSETYKSGGINYLEIIFASKDLSEFINRSYYFERLVGNDIDIVKEIKQRHMEISSKKVMLEEATNEIRGLTNIIQNKAYVVGAKVREEGAVYGALRQRRMEYERQVAELQATSRQIESWIQSVTRGESPTATAKGSGSFIWPLRGQITSRFGYRRNPVWGGSDYHTGLDIAAPYGRPIVAADSGTVMFASWWDGYGNCVIINHGRGLTTLYGHQSRIYVRKGQAILKGQTIGLVGSTGYSTGPHLHFEVRKNGTPTNPLGWL